MTGVRIQLLEEASLPPSAQQPLPEERVEEVEGVERGLEWEGRALGRAIRKVLGRVLLPTPVQTNQLSIIHGLPMTMETVFLIHSKRRVLLKFVLHPLSPARVLCWGFFFFSIFYPFKSSGRLQ